MITPEAVFFDRYRPEDLSDIFSFLSAEEMGELLPYLELREWHPEESVIKSGDSADFMGFLVEGSLAVKMEGIFPDKFILLALLERGSLVGEISVVAGGHRQATVVAMEKSSLLILTQENLELLLSRTPALGLKIFRRIIQVLGQRLGKASDRLSRLL